MALYQTSVLKNYLKRQDAVIVNKAYKITKYYSNTKWLPVNLEIFWSNSNSRTFKFQTNNFR